MVNKCFSKVEEVAITQREAIWGWGEYGKLLWGGNIWTERNGKREWALQRFGDKDTF